MYFFSTGCREGASVTMDTDSSGMPRRYNPFMVLLPANMAKMPSPETGGILLCCTLGFRSDSGRWATSCFFVRLLFLCDCGNFCRCSALDFQPFSFFGSRDYELGSYELFQLFAPFSFYALEQEKQTIRIVRYVWFGLFIHPL